LYMSSVAFLGPQMHKNRWQLRLRPRLHSGSTKCSPNLQLGFKRPTSKAPTSKGRRGEGRAEESGAPK